MEICRTPFFVWFSGRTGSTLLCDLLDSHPQIHCGKEVFLAIRAESCAVAPDPEQIIEDHGCRFVRQIHTPAGVIEYPTPKFAVDYLNRLFNSDSDASGFKLKFPSQSASFPEIVRELKKIENLKVIELSRDNALKQAISLQNVDRIRHLGVIRSGNSKQEVGLEPLQLDIESTIVHANFFLQSRTEFRELTREFSDIMYMSYEQLQQARSETMKRILGFLDVDDRVDLDTNFRKITPNRIRDAVANFDELADAIEGSKLEEFLD